MALNQGEVLQHQPEGAQPERVGNAASNVQPAPGAPGPPPASAGGQAPGLPPSFTQTLEQQIAQAIQPVLDDFRREMTQVVGQQVAPAAAPPAPAPQSEQAADASGQTSERPEHGDGHIPQHPFTETLRHGLQTVERRGEHWLEGALVSGLSALLTESAHAAVQQRAEQGLHLLLQKAFEAAPGSMSDQTTQQRIELALLPILRESIDALFAEGVRAAVQQEGRQAIRQSLQGDFRGARSQVESTLKTMTDALIAVLRRHRATTLRLVLALALLGLEASLAQPEHEKRAGSGDGEQHA